MKIYINTSKPCFITYYYYEGYITKDISSNDDEYIEGKYCFEIIDSEGDLKVNWLDDYTFQNKNDIEDTIIEQYLIQK